MPVPILLVTGFLGAGKTTLVNRILQQAHGRRIAAVVNDFGAINIDAELIAGAEDGVVSLANGCICCSLEGDLLRTLSNLLRRTPKPDAIVIETSGVADPEDIVRNLLDPVIWREAPLETVLCVADAASPEADLSDPLLLSQLRVADLIAVSKGDLVDKPTLDARRQALSQINRRATLVEAGGGEIPLDLVLPEVGTARERTTRPKRPSTDRFESFNWTAAEPISLAGFQQAIGRLASRLVRAKGILETVEKPDVAYLFQLTRGKATLTPLGRDDMAKSGTRIVFIAEVDRIVRSEIDEAMSQAGRKS
ncbi:GTP-binding protein [Bosea sp. (in: a-proteobacteria)]|uniref:CobW family GTP-binding protein n=1 Tax=Bosea sp. (in: a-proteobacteria) TaxID=1871050 RepID=UPI0011F57491|nr:GTP-binding protein [Bosea sp. (in: a-proteobacteria)]TAJ27639.1 MAG: GTP-binding protein [Bosea sp. (in: a-proteobacteria)]